jgi:hypothetical protein
MPFVQIKSGTFDNWTALFNSKFLDSGKFEKLSNSTKEKTEIEVFRLKGETGEQLTSIEIGYLEDRLFYLYISNPKIPGYMKFQEGEFFNRNDFTEGKSKGEPGLEFNEVNVKGILNEFKKGLQGRERHYLKGGKISKIELYPFPEKPDLSYTYDLEKEGPLEKFKDFFSKAGKNPETREINLNDIFSGI